MRVKSQSWLRANLPATKIRTTERTAFSYPAVPNPMARLELYLTRAAAIHGKPE